MSTPEYSIEKDLRETRELLLNEIKDIKRDNEVYRASLATLGGRVESIEDKIVTMGKEIAQLKIDKSELKTELSNLKDKITDASNRQRRRNVRIKFLPELEETHNMLPFLVSWWSKLGYNICENDLERAHRVTRRFESSKPRDTVVAFAREQKRDDFLKFFKSLGHVAYKTSKVLIFADLAPETVHKRALLNPIASLIIKNKFKFTWGFPASIIIYHKGEKLVASNTNEGKWLLGKLGISFDPLSISNPSQKASTSAGTTMGSSSSISPKLINSSQQSLDEDSSSTEMESSQQNPPNTSERKRKDLCEPSPESKPKNKRKHNRSNKKK